MKKIWLYAGTSENILILKDFANKIKLMLILNKQGYELIKIC